MSSEKLQAFFGKISSLVYFHSWLVYFEAMFHVQWMILPNVKYPAKQQKISKDELFFVDYQRLTMTWNVK
jgi:hypothetical protein